MTYHEKRLVTFLSGILGLLMIALVLVLAVRYRENRVDPAAPAEDPVIVSGTEEGAYVTLVYSTEAATLAFHREDERWVWTHDKDFPLNSAHIEAMLETLSALTPQQTLTPPESFDVYGLVTPVGTLTATMSDGVEYRVDFGIATTDGNSRYALLNGSSDLMYIIPDTLLEMMAVPIYDMYAMPNLPDLSAQRLRRVTIQGASVPEGEERVRVSMDALNESGVVTWTSNGKNVTSNLRLKGLLDDMANFTVEQCVDYRPSAAALSLCGFDDPAATLWANYTTPTELAGHFQLTVGGMTLDGAARYVRLGGDGFGEETVIFRVSTELLDPLIVIALGGLTA